MARQYSYQFGDTPEQSEEFAYRKGIKERYKQQLEDLQRGAPYDRAQEAARDETRRQGAELLAASNTRNIGALSGANKDFARQAAYQMAMMEMDKTEGALRATEALQQMDTTQSERNKKRREYAMAIKDYSRKSGALGMGIIGEQEDTALFAEQLAQSESDPELRQFLLEQATALRGGGKAPESGRVVSKLDV